MQVLKRILYVEDELDIQQVASIALEAVGGFRLKTCSSGQEALDKIEDFVPQLLLLDVMMPGIDGPTTLAKIRNIKAYENTPAIFMTAKVQPQEIQQYINMGAVEVISKPFDPMTLASQINDVWNKVTA